MLRLSPETPAINATNDPPNAVHKPKPVNDKSIARIVTAMETAGSGADDKVCINFAKFVNNLCISSYTIAK